MPRIARSEVVTPKQLSPEMLEPLIDSMHAVHCQVFTSENRETFSRFNVRPGADHTWLLLHRNEEGAWSATSQVTPELAAGTWRH